MLRKLMQFVKDEEGGISVEYILLIALIAVALIPTWKLLTTAIQTKIGVTTTAINAP